jgi:predicted dehydrogenase
MADPKVWRLNKALGGGGAIMDLGVYCIQGVRRTLNELPTSVLAQGFVTDKNVFKGIYEMMMFQMEFPSGAVSNSTTTYSSYIDRLYATTGYPVVWVRAFLQRHRCKRRILGRKNIFQNTCFSTD